MHRKTTSAFTLTTFLAAMAGSALADRAIQVEDVIWANDHIYDTILTDTNFRNPPRHSTDTLYNFDMSGLTGQRPVSDAAPGMPGYNGGRWSVKLVTFTAQGMAAHDPDGDGAVNFELMNAGDVLTHEGLGHFTIMDTDIAFTCPLIP